MIEVAKIILGGVGGLVIGNAILWYGFDLDVLGVMRSKPLTQPRQGKVAQVSEVRERQEYERSDGMKTEVSTDAAPKQEQTLVEQEVNDISPTAPLPEVSDSHDDLPLQSPKIQPETAPHAPRKISSRSELLGRLAGQWKVTYTNQTAQTRIIGGNGHTPRFQNGDVLIDFEKVVERWNLLDDKVFVEHFNPKSTYPDGFADVMGMGRRVEEISLNGEEPLIDASVDLLSLVQLPQNGMRGEWLKEGKAVLSPKSAPEQANAFHRARPLLEVPYDLPSSFKLKMIIVRRSGSDAILFKVPVAGRDIEIAFDVLGRCSGVNGIEASGVDYQHRAHVRNSLLFEIAKPRTVELIGKGNSIEIYLDGLWFFSWYDERIANSSATSANDEKQRLILGGFQDNVVEYQSVELLPFNTNASTPSKAAETTAAKVDKLDVPSTEKLAAAEETVRSVFEEDYSSAKKTEEKSALAEKLLAVGADTHDDLANRYVTLRSARNVAVASGNVDLAFRALAVLSRSFETDVMADRVRLCVDLANEKLTAEESGKLMSKIVIFRESAFRNNRFTDAVLLNQSAEKVGGTNEKEWRESNERWAALLKFSAAAYQSVEKSLESLRKDSNDATANAAVGRYYCLLKGDWQTGLPFLAKGNETTLTEIAKVEVGSANFTPSQTLSLAERWWAIDIEMSDIEKSNVLTRAGHLYGWALSNATGLSKVKAEKRVEELSERGVIVNVSELGNPHGDQSHVVIDETLLPTVITNRIGMKLVLIPAGDFIMGSADTDPDAGRLEQPQHLARIQRPFFMGVHEVTVGEFRQFVEDTQFKTDAETDGIGGWGFNLSKKDAERPSNKYSWRNPGFAQDDNHPVVNVSWNDATRFCEWLSSQHPGSPIYRLPSEREWEYACRAGTATRYSWGDSGESGKNLANLADASLRGKLSESPEYVKGVTCVDWNDGHPFTAPIGSYPANMFGLHDMSGNVAEYCRDVFARYNPKGGLNPNKNRVFRGGSFLRSLGLARSSARGGFAPTDRWLHIGFRVVREVE